LRGDTATLGVVLCIREIGIFEGDPACGRLYDDGLKIKPLSRAVFILLVGIRLCYGYDTSVSGIRTCCEFCARLILYITC
jgi:hypothetical protein